MVRAVTPPDDPEKPLGGVAVPRLFVAMCALALGLGATVFAAPPDTPKAAETRKKLQQKVSVDYQDTLLREVIDDLKSQVKGLGIRPDTTGGVSMNLKITYKADAKPLADVLDGMFKKNGLGYVVVSKEGDAYDGTLLIKQGKERGYPAGQEPTAAEKAVTKEKEKPVDKAASREKAPNQSKPATKDKEKPAEDGDKAEQIAASKLKLARQLADDGKTDKAKQRYEDIVKQYPDTKAAAEARQLLKKLEK